MGDETLVSCRGAWCEKWVWKDVLRKVGVCKRVAEKCVKESLFEGVCYKRKVGVRNCYGKMCYGKVGVCKTLRKNVLW
jgi:hypothetical protein